MQYSGCVKSLEGLILIGFQAGSQCGLVLFSFGCAGFGCRCLGTVLGYMSRIATKEAKVVIKSTLMFLRHQFTIYTKLRQKVRSGFLWCGSIALCRARVVLCYIL